MVRKNYNQIKIHNENRTRAHAKNREYFGRFRKQKVKIILKYLSKLHKNYQICMKKVQNYFRKTRTRKSSFLDLSLCIRSQGGKQIQTFGWIFFLDAEFTG